MKEKHIAMALLTPFFHFFFQILMILLENFDVMLACYISLLKFDIFGKYLQDVVDSNYWFQNNSILTNM